MINIKDIKDTDTIVDEDYVEWCKQSAIEEYRDRIKDGYEYGEDFIFFKATKYQQSTAFDIADYISSHVDYLDDMIGTLDNAECYSDCVGLSSKCCEPENIRKVLKEKLHIDVDDLNNKITDEFFSGGVFNTYTKDEEISFEGGDND